MVGYISRVCITISVLLNVLLGGELNQSFSARNHQRRRDGKVNIAHLIDLIYFWEPHHCSTAWSYWILNKCT